MLRNTLQSLNSIARSCKSYKFLTTPKTIQTTNAAKFLSISTAQPQSQKKE